MDGRTAGLPRGHQGRPPGQPAWVEEPVANPKSVDLFGDNIKIEYQ